MGLGILEIARMLRGSLFSSSIDCSSNRILFGSRLSIREARQNKNHGEKRNERPLRCGASDGEWNMWSQHWAESVPSAPLLHNLANCAVFYLDKSEKSLAARSLRIWCCSFYPSGLVAFYVGLFFGQILNRHLAIGRWGSN